MMPSFNDFLGGRAINETPTWERRTSHNDRSDAPFWHFEYDEAEIYLLDGTYLGTLNHLRRI